MRIKRLSLSRIVIVFGLFLSLALHCKSDNQVFQIDTFKINGGFGYQIYLDNKLTFKQSNIPGVEGNIPFRTKTQAITIGKLVISKIKNHEEPTISISELKQEGIEF